MDMDAPEQRIVGSAEPLTSEQRAVRLQELKAWGIDLSLVQRNLRLTPTERVQEALNLLAFAEEMRRGMQRYRLEARQRDSIAKDTEGLV